MLVLVQLESAIAYLRFPFVRFKDSIVHSLYLLCFQHFCFLHLLDVPCIFPNCP